MAAGEARESRLARTAGDDHIRPRVTFRRHPRRIVSTSHRAGGALVERLLRALAPLVLLLVATAPAPKERHLLYVASPGTRNYTEYGGVGLLVFDIDDGYRFVRRIPTWTTPEGKSPENV